MTYKSKYQTEIEDILQVNLNPIYLEVIDNSRIHARGSESSSHFKIICASPEFYNKSLINRHRLVNKLLNHLINNPIHSLEYALFNPDEWKSAPFIQQSPKCSGSKAK